MAVLLNLILGLENVQHYGSGLPKVKGLTLASPSPFQQCLYLRLSQSDIWGRLGLQQRALGSWGFIASIGGKGLGHSCGFLASSAHASGTSWTQCLGPGVTILFRTGKSPRPTLWPSPRRPVLHNALFCLIQLSGFVCEFCFSLCWCFS